MMRDIGSELGATLAINPTSHLGSALRNMSFQQAESLSLLTKKCPPSIYIGLMNNSVDDVKEALVKSGLGWKGDAPFRTLIAACRSVGISPDEQARARLNAALSRQLETGIVNIGLFLALINFWKSSPKLENIDDKVEDPSSKISATLTRIPSQLYVFDLIRERLFFSRQKLKEIEILGDCIGTEQFCRLLDAVDIKFPLTDPVFRTVLEYSGVLNEAGMIVVSALKKFINCVHSRRLSLDDWRKVSRDLTDTSDNTDIGRSISYGKIISTLRQAWPRVIKRIQTDQSEAEPMVAEHMLATAIRHEKVPLAAFDVKIFWRFLCQKLQRSQGEMERLRLTDIASIISPPDSAGTGDEVSSSNVARKMSQLSCSDVIGQDPVDTLNTINKPTNRRTTAAASQFDHIGSCLAWEVAADNEKGRAGKNKATSRRDVDTGSAAGVTTISMSQRPTSAPRRKIEPPRVDSLFSLSELLREDSFHPTEGGNSRSRAEVLGGRKHSASTVTVGNFLAWDGSFERDKAQKAEATQAATTLSLRASIRKKLIESAQVRGDKIRLLAQLPRLRQLKKREVLSRHFLKDLEGSSWSYSDVEACSPEDLVTLFTSIEVALTLQEASVLYIALLGEGSGATGVGKQGSVRLGEVVSHLVEMLS